MAARDTRTIRVTARLARETTAAIHVHQGEPSRAVWLPRSQISVTETGQRANGCAIIDITLPIWLAKDKGLNAQPPAGPGLFDGGAGG